MNAPNMRRARAHARRDPAGADGRLRRRTELSPPGGAARPSASRRRKAGSPRSRATAASGSPWWSMYGDPVLDELEKQIDVSNQTLKAAEANWRQAMRARQPDPRRAPADGGRVGQRHALGRPRRPRRDRRRRHHRRDRHPPDQPVRARRQRLVGARHLGQDPPPARGRQGERAGERGGSGRGAPVGAGDPRQRLLRAAHRRRAAAPARGDGRRVQALAADHREPVQRGRGRQGRRHHRADPARQGAVAADRGRRARAPRSSTPSPC